MRKKTVRFYIIGTLEYVFLCRKHIYFSYEILLQNLHTFENTSIFVETFLFVSVVTGTLHISNVLIYTYVRAVEILKYRIYYCTNLENLYIYHITLF